MTDAMKLSRELRGIAVEVDDILREAADGKVLFSLFVWGVPGVHRTQYVSNADRAEVVRAMKECLDRWAEGMPDIPAHEVQ